MLREIRIPWPWIALAFVVEMGYNQVLLHLPTTTAEMMSGSLENSAVIHAVIFYLSYGVVVTAEMFLLGFVCRMTIRNAREQIWGKMLRVRMDYYDSHTPTALTSAITNDLDASIGTLTRLGIIVLPSLYYLIEAIRTIGKYDFLLVLSVLIPIPLRYLYSFILGRLNFKTQAAIYGRIGTLTGYLAERVRNIPLIKQFGTEEQELKNGETASNDLFQANMNATKLQCGATGAMTLINVLGQITVILFGVLLLRSGRIDMTQWIAFFLFSSTITSRIIEVLSYWESIKTIQGQVARVIEILEAPQESTAGQGAGAASAQTGHAAPAVEFNHVTLHYGDKLALQDVSFQVPAGQITALVGLTGSGKTSSLNLLERFYEADGGAVTLDGVDVRKIALGDLRSRFSYVQQDAGVFSGTIREALTYGIRRTVSDQELQEAAQSAGAWEFIQRMPQGLDTVLAANGDSLSGGQRQRLVIAREFLKNADILLLDEPTSALDAQTAKAVSETIVRLFRGKTVLLVTHDMSLLPGMENIVVLSAGGVVGNGSYTNLMEHCPLFAEMVHSQQGEEVRNACAT